MSPGKSLVSPASMNRRKCICPKLSAAMIVRLSGATIQAVTPASRVNVTISLPSLRSQTRSVSPQEPETTWRPSGVTAKALTLGQSVKTTERGGARGFDAYKRVKGRKRHILVDTLGLLVANRVEPADTSDRRAGSLAAWRIECVVSEDQDGNSRCRPPKPQARSNPGSNTKDGSYESSRDDSERSRSRVRHGSWNVALPGWGGTAD